jgi:hypothetical protein
MNALWLVKNGQKWRTIDQKKRISFDTNGIGISPKGSGGGIKKNKNKWKPVNLPWVHFMLFI